MLHVLDLVDELNVPGLGHEHDIGHESKNGHGTVHNERQRKPIGGAQKLHVGCDHGAYVRLCETERHDRIANLGRVDLNHRENEIFSNFSNTQIEKLENWLALCVNLSCDDVESIGRERDEKLAGESKSGDNNSEI